MATQQRARQQVPSKGLWTSATADAIGPEYTPWCQNVRFRFGKVLRTPGRSNTLDTSSKSFMDFAMHTDASGNKTVFALRASFGRDGEIAPFDPTTNKFGTPIQPFMTARNDMRYSWTAGEEQLMIVRGSSVIQINNTSGQFQAQPIVDPGTGFNTPEGCFLEYFKNHTFLANILSEPSITPSDSQRPVFAPGRIRWSAEGQYNDWDTSTAGGSAHGGFLELYDGTVEAITGMKVLNDRLVVYRNSSIVDLNATGDAFNPFLPENRVFGIGCMLPWSLQSVGQFHVFVGNDFNVYAWDGSNLDPIGTPIHSFVRQLFDPGQLVTGDWTMVPFAATFMGFKEYWLVVPQHNAPTIALVYDYLRQSWTRDSFDGPVTALFEQVLPGAVNSPGWTPGHPKNYPTLMVGSGTQFYEIDERIVGDFQANGGIDMFVDTPDMFYSADAMQNGTLERVLVSSDIPRSAGEPPYELFVSVDRGNSFPYSATIQPIDEHWGFEFADLNITSNVRRYRFFYPQGAGIAVPTLRAYTDVYVPSGEFFPTIKPLLPPDPNIPPVNIN